MSTIKAVSLTLAVTLCSVFAQTYTGPDIQISGKVIDSEKKAISGASVELTLANLKAITDKDGAFSLVFKNQVHLKWSSLSADLSFAKVYRGALSIQLSSPTSIKVATFSIRGKRLRTLHYKDANGLFTTAIPSMATGVYFHAIYAGSSKLIYKDFCDESGWQNSVQWKRDTYQSSPLMRVAAEAFKGTLVITKAGYQDVSLDITNPEVTDLAIQMNKATTLKKFSFFVTSQKAIEELSGSKDGFGGDLRFGETGKGAGLRGADKICETIAEKSMPGAKIKQWRAFLSVKEDENGKTVHAIERIGEGPWYDRIGRLLAPTLKDLLNTRPANGDASIKNDLPNEFGVPNHTPDGNTKVDNHHFITGSTKEGKFYGEGTTCKDWTTSVGSKENGKPRAGFSWPRASRGGRGSNGAQHWISDHNAPGCGAGIETVDNGAGTRGDTFIGTGGGYGGFYCFAKSP